MITRTRKISKEIEVESNCSSHSKGNNLWEGEEEGARNCCFEEGTFPMNPEGFVGGNRKRKCVLLRLLKELVMCIPGGNTVLTLCTVSLAATVHSKI